MNWTLTFLGACPYTCLYTCVYTCPYTCRYTCLYTCPYTCLYPGPFTYLRGFHMPTQTHVDTYVCTHAWREWIVVYRCRCHLTSMPMAQVDPNPSTHASSACMAAVDEEEAHMCISMSVCVSARMPVPMSIHMSVYMSIRMSICMSVGMPVRMSAAMSTDMSVCMCIHMSVQCWCTCLY